MAYWTKTTSILVIKVHVGNRDFMVIGLKPRSPQTSEGVEKIREA